jgi:hypothetical protein
MLQHELQEEGGDGARRHAALASLAVFDGPYERKVHGRILGERREPLEIE